MGASVSMTRRGWTAETIRPGDEIKVVGQPSRIPGTFVMCCARVDQAGRQPAPSVGARGSGLADATGLLASLRRVPFQRPRAEQQVLHPVVTLVARVLVDESVRLRQVKCGGPRALPRRRVLEPHLVAQDAGLRPREALDQCQVFSEATPWGRSRKVGGSRPPACRPPSVRVSGPATGPACDRWVRCRPAG